MKSKRHILKTAVVLLSGGLDSAVTLYLAGSRGYKCRCLIFDYGQRHKREIFSAKKIAANVKVPYQLIKIDFPWKGSALLDKRMEVLKSGQGRVIPMTYVPGRNIIFLSFALSYAETLRAEAVFIGAHAQDYSGYPDCRGEFFQAFKKVARVGTKAGIEKRGIGIEAPLLNMKKAEIIQLGSKLKVPFGLTWSCYKGGNLPCGRCDSCYYRAKGFRDAGLADEGQD